MERKSSIDSEPRTLKINQIQYAREAALNVVNNKSIEEAFTIFTKGLKPVVTAARAKGNTVVDVGEDWDCLTNTQTLSIGIRELRDVFSAPF